MVGEEYYIFHHCYFSTMTSPNVTREVGEMLILEDITDEEMEAASADRSKESVPKEVKPKVPQK